MRLSMRQSAAVAAAEAIEETVGKPVAIKWVNDIYYRDRKVCGILAEGGVEQGVLSYVVLGIGVNISPPKGGFPDDIAEKAGTLFDVDIDVSNELTQRLLERFDAYYHTLAEYTHRQGYRSRSWLDGKQVQILSTDDTPQETVTVLGVDQDLSLIVSKDGKQWNLRSGDVSVIPLK